MIVGYLQGWGVSQSPDDYIKCGIAAICPEGYYKNQLGWDCVRCVNKESAEEERAQMDKIYVTNSSCIYSCPAYQEEMEKLCQKFQEELNERYENDSLSSD